jgi:uncharacterized membrane protein
VSSRRKKRPPAARRTPAPPAGSPAPAREEAAAGAAAATARARSRRPRRWLPWTLAALAYAGFVLSAYLTIVHFRGYVSPCYVVQGCETVQTSKYSVILGVPVALAGAVYFGLLFYLTVGLLRSSALWLVRAFKVLSFLGALAAIPLFLLQAIVLKAFCSYCLATEVLMLAIWVLGFLLAAPERRDGTPEPSGSEAEPLEAGAAAE